MSYVKSKIKYLAVFLLILIFTFTLNFSNPEPVEAEVIVGTVLIGAALLLVACGVIVADYQSSNAIANHFWNNATTNIRNLFLAGIDEETRTLTVHNDVFDFARDYVTDNYAIGNTSHLLPSGRIMSPWGTSYIYTPIVFDMDVITKSVTQEFYNSAQLYESITWDGKVLDYGYVNWMYSYLNVDGVRFDLSGEEHNMYRFYDVDYYNSGLDQNVYYDYGSADVAHTADSQYGAPKFSFFYNLSTSIMTPVALYYYSSSYCTARIISRTESDTYYYGETATQDSTEVNAVIDGTIVLDTEYTIDNPLSIPYSLSELIGQAAGEVIAEEWADVMTIDRYIELYGSIPVTVDATLEMPTSGAFEWTKLNMNIELVSDKFPFSIPFDLKNAIVGLSATPEVPIFTQNLTLAGINGGDLSLDFTPFQPLANIIRWGILILFNIGLILTTRKLIRG